MTSGRSDVLHDRKRVKRDHVNKTFHEMIKASYPDLTPCKGYKDYDIILVMPSRGNENPKNPTVNYAVGVSSGVLAIASPVFDTMFNGLSAEGQAAVNGSRLRKIILPEDNVMHVRMLCDVLYHCSKIDGRRSSETKTQRRDAERVCGLLTIAHKYDCIAAIRPICTMFCTIQTADNRYCHDGPYHYAKMAYLIMISYVLRDGALFSKATRDFVIRVRHDRSIQSVFDRLQYTHLIGGRLIGDAWHRELELSKLLTYIQAELEHLRHSTGIYWRKRLSEAHDKDHLQGDPFKWAQLTNFIDDGEEEDDISFAGALLCHDRVDDTSILSTFTVIRADLKDSKGIDKDGDSLEYHHKLNDILDDFDLRSNAAGLCYACFERRARRSTSNVYHTCKGEQLKEDFDEIEEDGTIELDSISHADD